MCAPAVGHAQSVLVVREGPRAHQHGGPRGHQFGDCHVAGRVPHNGKVHAPRLQDAKGLMVVVQAPHGVVHLGLVGRGDRSTRAGANDMEHVTTIGVCVRVECVCVCGEVQTIVKR